MQIKISSQFADDFKSIKDVSLHQKVKNVLREIEQYDTMDQLHYFKSIKGNDRAFKMAIGFYFLVVYQTGISEYTFMRCLSRDNVLKFKIN